MSESTLLTITTVGDKAVQLSLTTVRVRMTLSDELLRQMRDEIAADPDTRAPGLVGRFARFITGAVDKTLSTGIEYAIADIESVTVRDGALVFVYGRRSHPSFDEIRIGSNGATKPVLASFAPADAQTFADRFAEVKAQQR